MKIYALFGVIVVAMTAVSDTWAANPARGRDLYNRNCAACHGPGGEGVSQGAPRFKFGERLEKPDMLLLQSVKTGKRACPPQFGILQDADILDILSYVRTLR